MSYCKFSDGMMEQRQLIIFLSQIEEIQAYNEGAPGGYNYWLRFPNFTWIYWTYVAVSKVWYWDSQCLLIFCC